MSMDWCSHLKNCHKTISHIFASTNVIFNQIPFLFGLLQNFLNVKQRFMRKL